MFGYRRASFIAGQPIERQDLVRSPTNFPSGCVSLVQNTISLLTSVVKGPPNRRPPRPPARPSTAPSPVNMNSPLAFGRVPYSPSSCMIAHSSDPPGSQHTRVHLKSTSTDSILSYGLSSQPIDTDPTSRRVRELFNLKALLRR